MQTPKTKTNRRELFSPLWIAGSFLFVVCATVLITALILARPSGGQLAHLLAFSIIASGAAAAVFLWIALDDVLRAPSTPNWQEADLAVLLGFGYQDIREEEKLLGKANETGILPGRANEELADWVIKKIQSGEIRAKTCLVQEGFLSAFLERADGERIQIEKTSEEKSLWMMHIKADEGGKGTQIARLHRHNEYYVNTYNALYLASEKIENSRPRKILLIAHDLQAGRCVFTWKTAANDQKTNFANLELVVPDCGRKFSGSWSFVHPWTYARWIYRLAELPIRIGEKFDRMSDEELSKVRIPGIY